MKVIDRLQGKSIVNGLTAEECKIVFKYLGLLEQALDEAEDLETFDGQEWKNYLAVV